MSANLSPDDFEDETFLTVADVAKKLKLNPQTVRNWIDQGSMPAIRVGRRVRIKRSDFQRILDENYRGAPQPAPPPGPSAEDFWGGEPVGLPEAPFSPDSEPSSINGGAAQPTDQQGPAPQQVATPSAGPGPPQSAAGDVSVDDDRR